MNTVIDDLVERERKPKRQRVREKGREDDDRMSWGNVDDGGMVNGGSLLDVISGIY